MEQIPEVQYLTTDSGSFAYQSFGGGPGCVVVVPGFLSHIEASWSRPEASWFWSAMAKFSRVVLLEKRGIGLSDPAPISPAFMAEGRAADVAAIVDALRLERISLYGIADGGPGAITYAAMNPQRVEALVLHASYACLSRPQFYPDGYPDSFVQQIVELCLERWGNDTNPMLLERLNAARAHDTAWRLWVAHMERLAASPARAASLIAAQAKLDVRGLLPLIKARTLIIHATGDDVISVVNGRDLARRVAGARLVELPSTDHFPSIETFSQILDLVQGFLTGQPPIKEDQRRVATIVFTDVVDSTRTVAALGNEPWAALLQDLHAGLRGLVGDSGGIVVDTAGDGMLSLFEVPRQAIVCAAAMLRFVRTLNLEARAGIHTGEVEIRGAQVAGLAVHTAARIAAMAGSGEIVASRTLKDLLAGSPMAFSARGTHSLKGVPDLWELYSLTSSSP